ncbi:Fe3+-hydroxamate ABC transporter,periplasmic protein [Actinobacillus pleuropneumoniae]|nr:Fe3+-hydroxamate ABC transporter,periplasmic protein [Actinobacillus pleuropneumoniae]
MFQRIKLTAVAFATLFALSGFANAKPTEITDVLERKVTVEFPANEWYWLLIIKIIWQSVAKKH